MLLTSLDPAAVTGGRDIGDAVRIGDVTLSRSDVVGAATSVAERVGGADRIAVLATPTASTALAIAGCLIAGVPVVPVPADVGQAERRHILNDSGVQAWLGPVPDEPEGLPHIPVRTHARSWHRHARAVPAGHRADHLHLGHHRPAQRGAAEWSRDRRRPGRAGPGLAVDIRGHLGARIAALPRARAGVGSARVAARRKPLRAHRKTNARGLRGSRRHPVLRCADGVVTSGG